MRKMPEIKAENGEVKSIDGNVIPRTKLYAHYIVFNETRTDKCYAFLIDDNPKSYKEVSITQKYSNLRIPCFGIKIDGGEAYQYLQFSIEPNLIRIRFGAANLETKSITTYSTTLMGSFISSDTVTPLN